MKIVIIPTDLEENLSDHFDDLEVGAGLSREDLINRVISVDLHAGDARQLEQIENLTSELIQPALLSERVGVADVDDLQCMVSETMEEVLHHLGRTLLARRKNELWRIHRLVKGAILFEIYREKVER